MAGREQPVSDDRQRHVEAAIDAFRGLSLPDMQRALAAVGLPQMCKQPIKNQNGFRSITPDMYDDWFIQPVAEMSTEAVAVPATAAELSNMTSEERTCFSRSILREYFGEMDFPDPVQAANELIRRMSMEELTKLFPALEARSNG